MNRKLSQSDTAEINWKMLTRAGFELAPSGYRSAALLLELSSPQGLEASFIQLKRTRYSRHILWWISVKLSCEYLVHFSWIKLASNPCRLDSSGGGAADRRTGIPKVRIQIPLESIFFSWLRQCQIIMNIFCSCFSEDDSEVVLHT